MEERPSGFSGRNCATSGREHGRRGELVLLEVELREERALLDVAAARVQHHLVDLEQVDHVDGDHDGVADDLAGALAVLDLQLHVGLVLVVAFVGGVAPAAERAHLRHGLEEVEHERLPPRDGDDEQLALHALDEHVLRQRPVQRRPQHVLGAVEERLAKLRALHGGQDGGAAGLWRGGGEIPLVLQELAGAQRPGLLDPDQHLDLVHLQRLHAGDDHGLRLGRVLPERRQLLEPALALHVLVLLVEDQQPVLGAVHADGAQQVVVEVRDVVLLQVVRHHQMPVLLHPHLRQPRKPLDRHTSQGPCATNDPSSDNHHLFAPVRKYQSNHLAPLIEHHNMIRHYRFNIMDHKIRSIEHSLIVGKRDQLAVALLALDIS
jgi:hypothetical protein